MSKFNPALPFVNPHWKGNPTDSKGRFVNHEFPFTTRFADVWKWQTGPKPHREAKKLDTWKPELVQDASFVQQTGDCLVWLGHAWFFLRLGGIQMLIDPVLYKIPLVTQHLPNPYPPETFVNIDYLLLSHDHRDHMDQKSIARLGVLNPQMQIITGLNMAPTLKKWTKNSIVEMGWYQQWEQVEKGLKITYMPTRHWCRRYLHDINQRLWGAFVIEANGKTIYFGSDSGYGGHFQELRQYFPDIDIAMLGIGAFRPEWFMHQAHMSPQDAVKACNDSGAKAFFPMHHGMLDLSDEPAGEPWRLIEEAMEKQQIHARVMQPAVGACLSI